MALPSLIRLDLDRQVAGEARSCPWGVHVHPDVFGTLQDPDRSFLARRVSLVLGHLALRGTSPSTKTTAGANEGWCRTGLRGTGGSHFYLWWAKAGTKALRHLDLPSGTVWVRTIRHHDDHASLDVDDPSSWTLLELDREGGVPGIEAPWTEAQLAFVRAEDPVRVMVGQAGGGKTQALWQAVATRGGERVLLVTWSGPLADETRQQLGGEPGRPGFLTADTTLAVLPYRQLLGQLLGRDVPHRSLSVMRRQFLDELAALKWSRTRLSEWHGRPEALFAELRAHHAGYVPDNYWERSGSDRGLRRLVDRRAETGKAGEEAEGVWQRLRLTDEVRRAELFPELEAAHEALALLLDPGYVLPSSLQDLDRLVLDEVQDLTRVELAVLVELARRTGERRQRWPFLLVAGDEGQSVRPTGFRFPWLGGLLGRRYAHVKRFEAARNLRSPAALVEVIDRATGLYTRQLARGNRPRKNQRLEADSVAEARLLHLRTDPESACTCVRALADAPGTAVVVLGDVPPAWLSDVDTTSWIRTPEDIKGLEFDKVVLLDPGQELAVLEDVTERAGEQLEARVRIDRLRVALSRATDLLAFVDAGTPEQADLAAALLFGEERTRWRTVSPEVFALAFRDADAPDPLARVEQLLRQGLTDCDEIPEAAERAFAGAIETFLHLVDSREWDGHRQQDALDLAIRLGVLLLAGGHQAGGEAGHRALAHLLAPAGREDLGPVLKALVAEGAIGAMDARAVARLLRALSGLPRNRWTVGLDRALGDHAHYLLGRMREVAVNPELAVHVASWDGEAVSALGLPDGARDLRDLQEQAMATLAEAGAWPDVERMLSRMDQPPDHWVVQLAARRGDWRMVRDVLLREGRVAEAAAEVRKAGQPREALALLVDGGESVPPELRQLVAMLDWLEAEGGQLLAADRILLRESLGGEDAARQEREAALGGIADVRDSYRRSLERAEAEAAKARRLQDKVRKDQDLLAARAARLDRLVGEIEEERRQIEQRRVALGQIPSDGGPGWRQQLEDAESRLLDMMARETNLRLDCERLAARLAEREDEMTQLRQALQDLQLREADGRAQAQVHQAELEGRVHHLEQELARQRAPQAAVPPTAPDPVPAAAAPIPAVLERKVPALRPSAIPSANTTSQARASEPPSRALNARLVAGVPVTLAEAAVLAGFDPDDLLEQLYDKVDPLPAKHRPLTVQQAKLVAIHLDMLWKPLAAFVGQRPLSPLALAEIEPRLGRSRRLADIAVALGLTEKRAMPVVQRVLAKTPKSGRDLSLADCVKVVAALTGLLDVPSRQAIRRCWE